ncbi:MAG: tetratricopeptide repeat protein [Verrucomicrobiae bacterium]|nr:tetratricopeptide repeat protein [Verrucomicrobiae bacterium]MCP5539603.1 tetratricopeptide repeat protein [Akkermansiaceae bacterium]MCP5549341.1 tetratricopeptide repeat protein [Akkermansiaceae bacterium]
MSDISTLSASLDRDPGNWDIRLQLADALIAGRQPDEALAVLRTNPLSPITPEQSKRARQLIAELDPNSTAARAESAPQAEATGDVSAPGADSAPVMLARIVEDDDEADASTVASVMALDVETEPGYEAAGYADDEHADHRSFIVAEGYAIPPAEKESDAAQKVSAISLALLIHAAVFLILGFVVISMPRPNPPQVVATLSQPDTDDVVEQVTINKAVRSASSASAKPSFVITAQGLSEVSAPEFDAAATTFDVTMGSFTADIGMGMSFEEGEMESNVNFFGIKSKGSRIVLLIEAARFMLTDDKGGIPAYDKVKEDIGKMLGGLNKLTAFNVVLFEGKKIATFQDQLVPASPSNVRKAIEWIHPINLKYEELGIREDYTSQPLQEGVEPIPVDDLSHYIKALQRSLEMDVNTVFLLTSGWVHIHKPLDERELEKFYRDYKWGEKEEAAWIDAVKKAQAWLDKENAARRAKGVPQRVIRDWHEIVREILPNVRRKPGPGYTMEEVEDQVKNAVNTYYRAANKPKPEVNLVWFVGEDEEPSITLQSHFENLARKNRGKMRLLEGLAGLTNVTDGPGE